ncbi:MAG TPA: hypothetical protein VJ828_13530, partial [Lacipirellulaceae bacterium]|nr:hypothetical protein [Lacipirellulaceae bacterium]
ASASAFFIGGSPKFIVTSPANSVIQGEDPLFYVQMFGMSSGRRTGRDGRSSVAAAQRVK